MKILRVHKNKQSGFIALISAIIISVLLLTITLSGSMAGIWGRLNILDSESKERSLALAEGCVDTAILNLTQESMYIGAVPVGSEECEIKEVNKSGNSATIKTQAKPNKAYTNLVVVIDTDDYTVTSWDEMPNYP